MGILDRVLVYTENFLSLLSQIFRAEIDLSRSLSFVYRQGECTQFPDSVLFFQQIGGTHLEVKKKSP